MKTSGILSKSLSFLIIGIVLYMHLCSALCALGTSVCCNTEDDDKDHPHKSCCDHKTNEESKDEGCQDMHFAFFGATGQYTQDKADFSIKSFSSVVAAIVPLYILQPIGSDKTLFDYNSFHQPPSRADIRLFIHSFLI